MYTVKNVKTLNTYDGYAYTATLYKDGKKVGTLEQGGHGGSTDVQMDGSTWADREPMLAEFAAWTRENCADSWIKDFVGGTSADSELGADMLVERFLLNRDLARASKTKIVFRLPEDGETAYRTVKVISTRQAAIDWIMREEPTASIWSVESERWFTPVSV